MDKKVLRLIQRACNKITEATDLIMEADEAIDIESEEVE